MSWFVLVEGAKVKNTMSNQSAGATVASKEQGVSLLTLVLFSLFPSDASSHTGPLFCRLSLNVSEKIDLH